MEIRRIGENKIRCALTEEEICEMGFDIDEIIGNGETTQQFMRTVLAIVEEQEHIDVSEVAPMVKAEILPNHTMAITFGADAELALKDLVEAVSHLVNQLVPQHLEELKMALQQREAHEYETRQVYAEKSKGKHKAEPMICALRFASIADISRMCRVCFPGRVPKSSLYKLREKYYLVLDFTGFAKEELRPFAFGTIEFDDARYSDVGQIAHIMEQGVCIIKSEALQMLMQL